MAIEAKLTGLIEQALAAASGVLGISGAEFPAVELDRPRQKEFGDFSTNIALALASRAGLKPRDVAQAILDHLPESDVVSTAEVAGPGFINFHVTHGWLYDALRAVVARGTRYGWVEEPSGETVQVEFVSANPTGPLHIGHARNAALGDALARLLEVAGSKVEREYYFNDAGGQMDRFGASVEARYLQLAGRDTEVPEDGYHGDYVTDLAKDILAKEGPGLADLRADQRFVRLREEGSARVLEMIRATLDRFGIHFDTFFSESSLTEKGEIAAAVDRMREAGFAYDSEGATWFKATEFGDDKDRVVIRSNGAHTYFGADCAYLIDKFSRGFDHLIYVWGADHHGDVARVTGAAEALGYDPAAVEMVIYQWVAFLRGGEPVPMSKRSGNFVTLDELLDEVGADAARFTLLSQSHDSVINFDIEEVKRLSLENPVYYVQYAHARIASILRTAAERGVPMRPLEDADLELLTVEAEVDLLREISELPEQVVVAAELRAPHRLTHYARALAERFHRFYVDCRVVSEDEALTQARMWLSAATKQTIANVLDILGVSAPESMERTDE